MLTSLELAHGAENVRDDSHCALPRTMNEIHGTVSMSGTASCVLLQSIPERRMVGHVHFQAAPMAHLEHCPGHRPLTGSLQCSWTSQ